MKRLIFALFFLSSLAFGQGVRVGDERPVETIGTIAGHPGNWLKAIPTATINFCTAPANGVPCTNKATTYTDSTLATSCSTSTQIVLAGTNSCTGSTDLFGNWGVWVPSGQYEYTVTVNGASSGPYPVTAGGSGGGAGVGTILTGNAGAIPLYTITGTTLGPSKLSDDGTNLVYASTRFGLGGAGLGNAILNLNGNTSGTVGITVNPAAGNWNLTLPNGAGTTGQVLTTDGTGLTSWTTVSSQGGSGTVDAGSNNQLAIYTGPNTVAGDPGLVHSAGVLTYTTAANTGGINLTGSYTTGGTGPTIQSTGTVTTTGQGLSLFLAAANGVSGTTPAGGGLSLTSGNGVGANAAGDMLLTTGSSASGSGGQFIFTAGGGGVAGKFKFIGGPSGSTGTTLGLGGTINLAHSSGAAVIIGNNSPQVSGLLQLYNGNNNYFGLKASNTLVGWTMTVPDNAGTNGQVLTTNGAGVTSWTTVNTGPGTITGSGTSGKVTCWNGASTITNCGISDSGTTVSTAENLLIATGTSATNVSNFSSPTSQLGANYWTGAASAQDLFTVQNVSGSGSNPTQTLTITHSGSSGTASIASALPVAFSGGSTLGGAVVLNGTLSAASTTSSIPWITGAGAPAGGTCTVNGQVYYRTDGTLGQQLYFCNGSGTWTLQLGPSSAVWNAISNPNGNLALSVGNFTSTFTAGTNTTTPFVFQDTTANAGTSALVTIQAVGTSTAQGLSVVVPANGTTATAATFQAGNTGYAIKVPNGQGNIGFNRLVSTSANAQTSGCSICFGSTDTARYWNGSTSTNMTLIGGGGAGPVHVGDTPGIDIAGPITTLTAGGALTLTPLAATSNGNGGDLTLGAGAGAGTGNNGNIHLSLSTVGTGRPGFIDIGGGAFGPTVNNDSTNPPIANGLVVSTAAGNAAINQQQSAGILGICVPSSATSCTNSGTSTIAQLGAANCIFDSVPVTIGDYVGPSQANNGQCTDIGNPITTNTESVGIITQLVTPGTNPVYKVSLNIGGAPPSTTQFVLKNATSNQIVTTGNTAVTPLEIDCSSGSTAPCFIVKDKNGATALSTSANGVTTFGNALGSITASHFVTVTANPATAAATNLMQLAKTDCLAWNNNANSADLTLCKDTSDLLGITGGPGWYVTNAGGGNKVSFSVTNPASPRTITFNDPLGNDSVVYLAAAQTLSGKTIAGTGIDFTTATAPANPSAGKIRLYADSGTGNLTCLTSAGGNCLPGGGGAGAWSALTDPAGNLALAMGNNSTAFTGSTNTPIMFAFLDTTGNTSVLPLVDVHSVGTSTALPIRVTAKGTSNGFKMTALGDLTMIGTGSLDYGTADNAVYQCTNEGVTGTSNKLVAKLSGAACITATTADLAGVLGVVKAGGATTGTAQVVTSGYALCTFSNGTTAGHYAGVSNTVAGNCLDLGTQPVAGAQVLGMVMSAGAGGTDQTILLTNANIPITGTANQVLTSYTSGGLTLSLPQNIHTAATPTFAGLLLNTTGITGSSGTTSFPIQCGQDANASAACTLTLRGGAVTGAGNFNSGSVKVIGGANASTGTGVAGTASLEAGHATAASNKNGGVKVNAAYIKGTTSTTANVQCFTADNTVQDCAVNAVNFVGIALGADSNAQVVQLAGSQVTVNYDASVSPSAGWFACTSQTVAGKVTAQAAPCAAGRTVGIIEAGGTTVTSGLITMAHF